MGHCLGGQLNVARDSGGLGRMMMREWGGMRMRGSKERGSGEVGEELCSKRERYNFFFHIWPSGDCGY